LGIIIDRTLKWFDKAKKKEDNRKYFMFHLNQVTPNLTTKLKDAYENFHKNTNIDTGIKSTPPVVISSDFQRLLNINHEAVFDAFKEKEILSKILGHIALIDKVQLQVSEFHIKVLGDSGKIRDELEIRIDEYISLLCKYLGSEKRDNSALQTSETYVLVNDLVVKYYTEIAGTRRLADFQSKIVTVIQERIVSTDEFRANPIVGEIAENGKTLTHLISKLTDKTKEITDEYKVYSDYMDNANKAMAILIPTLK
jgi:hypothetical protein